jgi:hypothetical protein
LFEGSPRLEHRADGKDETGQLVALARSDPALQERCNADRVHRVEMRRNQHVRIAGSDLCFWVAERAGSPTSCKPITSGR